MAVPDVPMLGFRAQQAVMDLRAVAGRQPRSALRAVADLVPPASKNENTDAKTLARIVLRQGARLERTEDKPLIDALMLAASQPDRAPAAFSFATAVLLADRIQLGLGWDDLGQFWSTYKAAYERLDPHDRAAIVQGFLAGAALNRVRMPPPEANTCRLTHSADTVCADLIALARRGRAQISAGVEAQLESVDFTLALPHLRNLLSDKGAEPLTGDSPVFPPLLALASQPRDPGFIGATSLLLAQAVRVRDAEGWFGVTLWRERAPDWLRLAPVEARPILAGLRYLYEIDPSWVPQPDRLANLAKPIGHPLLPVLDATFGPDNPGARVG